MKNKINFTYVICFILIMTGAALLQSCAVYGPNTARLVTVPDIIQMSKDGVSSKDIIRDIKRTHTVYGLKADQLANLRDQGVQDSVINYMEKTHMDAIRQNQWNQDYWWPGYNGYLYGGLGFGWPFYGGFWRWGWGPSIVFNYRGGGGYYHGGFSGGGGLYRGGAGGRRR
jgi:hypothetical protein